MGEKKRKPRTVTRNQRLDTIKDPTPDQLEEAVAESQKLVKLHRAEGTKRSMHEFHETLPGVKKSVGDNIQAIVALRIQGFRDVDIAKRLDMHQPYISQIEKKHPEAFAKAEVHHLTQAERKYKVNLWGVRAALSELAPRMIRVLGELAENEEVKDNIRRQAAIDVLNLVGVGYSRQSQGGRDTSLSAGAQTFIQQNIRAGAEVATETVTVDAESVEVIDE